MDIGYSTREKRRAGLWLLLIGMFSVTQIRVGFSIGISEIFVYIAAPFLFLKNYAILKRHGMLPYIYMGMAVSFACVVSGLYNRSSVFFIFKGLASTYPLFAFVVVLHHLLIRNMNGHRWLYLGTALSFIINIFIFQTSYELDTYAQGSSHAAEAIMSGPIFWIGRLTGLLSLPYKGWFLQTPLLYSVLMPVAIAVFSMGTSESGRAAALAALGGAFIVIFCGKSQSRMRRFCRNFWVIVCIGLVALFCLTAVYKFAGSHGMLNEKATAKFEKQTRGGGSMLRILMAGRSEFFIGVMAALDKPVIGHGPWAIDDGHYQEEFLTKYGDEEDYRFFLGARQHQAREGLSYVNYIPTHSHIGSFWLWFGVVGLMYWAYIVYMLIRFLHREIAAVPQWFGVLAMGAPSLLWALFFSGFGYRIVTMPFVVMLMMAHNVYKGRIQLPYDMVEEAYRYEHRR